MLFALFSVPFLRRRLTATCVPTYGRKYPVSAWRSMEGRLTLDPYCLRELPNEQMFLFIKRFE